MPSVNERPAREGKLVKVHAADAHIPPEGKMDWQNHVESGWLFLTCGGGLVAALVLLALVEHFTKSSPST